MSITFILNGEERRCVAAPMTPLVDVLREEFNLTGTKVVCREGFCGACTVLVEGATAASCLMPVAKVGGTQVRTIESVGAHGALSPVQQALQEFDAVQCGMCFPGMVMAITALLAANPTPTREEVKVGLAGNICRCTGYERIVDAAMHLSERNQSEARND